jgi:drug/metabolite transporter (DMT)-like permease
LGLIVLFIGILGWASGTLFTKKITIHSDNILLNLFYQFAFAGIVQLIFAVAYEKIIGLHRMSRIIMLLQRIINTVCQVFYGVEQCAIEVEYD